MQKLIFLAAFFAVSYGITSQDFYRFVPGDGKQVPAGDYTSSSEISLAIPAKYYDQEFDYVWVRQLPSYNSLFSPTCILECMFTLFYNKCLKMFRRAMRSVSEV